MSSWLVGEAEDGQSPAAAPGFTDEGVAQPPHRAVKTRRRVRNTPLVRRLIVTISLESESVRQLFGASIKHLRDIDSAAAVGCYYRAVMLLVYKRKTRK